MNILNNNLVLAFIFLVPTIISRNSLLFGLIPILIYSLKGKLFYLRALVGVWGLTIMSPDLAENTTIEFSVLKFVTVLSAFIPLLFSPIAKPSALVFRFEMRSYLFFFLLLLIFLHCIFLSQMPFLSAIKFTLWGLGFFVILNASVAISLEDLNILQDFIYKYLSVYMVLSMLFINSPIAYGRNGTGFQGITSHPQVFGPLAAILSALCFYNMIKLRKFNFISLVMFVLSFYGIYMSQARTALLALIIGIGVWVFFGEKKSSGVLKNINFRIILISVILSSFYWGGVLAQTASNFIFKHGGGDFQDAYLVSRGEILTGLAENIVKFPITGIGFAVPSDFSNVDTSAISSLSFPIEKSVLYLQIIEELGFLLGLAVLLFLLRILINIIRIDSGFSIMVVLVFLLNFGEATFLSLGGFGLIGVLIFCGGFAMAKKRASK